MPDKVKIAAVQTNPNLKENNHNLVTIINRAREAANNGAHLVIFPECSLSGYVYSSRKEALPFMESIPGDSTREIARLCREIGVYIIYGLLERDGNSCYNSAVLIGPEGLTGKYRKIHLPFLGIDRYLDKGDEPFRVFQTPVGNIGIIICYDNNFPESARVLAVEGADIIALITNWPQGREKVVKYVVNTRAFENRVNLAAVDRVGLEGGTTFLGHSKIISAGGDTLAEAGSTAEETIYAEVSLAEARNKRQIFTPGEFETDLMGDRRPEFYGVLTRNKPKTRMKTG
jgi:predicted amidohydrolase